MDSTNLNEYILAQLRSGLNADDVANELSKALNDANKAYTDECAKQVKKAQHDDAEIIAQLLEAYARNYYNGFGISTKERIFSAEEIDELFKALHELNGVMSTFLEWLPKEKKNATPGEQKSIKCGNITKDEASRIIQEFLNELK